MSSSDATHFSDLFDTRYYTREQLRELRAKLDGLDGPQEDKFRRQMHKFVEKMCTELKMNPWVGESAMVFVERFFSQRSYTNNDRFLVAAGALFMAAKARDNPRPVRHVAHAYHKVKLSGKPQELAAFLKDAERIIAESATIDGLLCAERALLYTLRFDVREYYVYNAGHKYGHLMGLQPAADPPGVNTLTLEQQKLLSQLVIMFQKDIFKTQLMLQLPPRKAAACCVLVAAERANISIKQPTLQQLEQRKLEADYIVNDHDVACFKAEVLSLYNEIDIPGTVAIKTQGQPAAAAAAAATATPAAAAAAATTAAPATGTPTGPTSTAASATNGVSQPAAAASSQAAAPAATAPPAAGSSQPARPYSKPPPPPTFHASSSSSAPAAARRPPAAGPPSTDAPSPPDPQLRSINDDQNNNNNTPAAAALQAAASQRLGVAPSLEEGELPPTPATSLGAPAPTTTTTATLLPPEQQQPADGAVKPNGELPPVQGSTGSVGGTAGVASANGNGSSQQGTATAAGPHSNGSNGAAPHEPHATGSLMDVAAAQSGVVAGATASVGAALGSRKRSRELSCCDGVGCGEAGGDQGRDREMKAARVVPESAV